MRTWHYWKRAGPASAPSNILVVDTEAYHGRPTVIRDPNTGQPIGEHQRFRLGCALAYRLERQKRTRIQLLHFRRTEQFWSLARDRLDNRRPLWIFAHNCGYDFPMLDGWERILSGEFEADQVILSQTMFLIRGLWHGMPLVIADTTNYYHCKLEDIGKAVGIPKKKMPLQSDPDSAWAEYCENDVLVTAEGIDRLIDFNRQHELGPWGVSIASLAFNAFRHRFMDHKILVCPDRDVCSLERNAYFGGIVDTQYIGEVPFSPVYELDVNSMYGWACQQRLPYRIIPTRYCPSMKALSEPDPDKMSIAEVTISHDTLRFPLRTRHGTCYPVGTYRTTLCDPELRVALAVGAVKGVHRATLYRSANIFAGYMEYFGNLKIRYRSEDNPAFETLSKYWITNLYGKTGQRRPKWERWGEESLQRLEREHGLAPGALSYCYDHPPERHRFEQKPWIDAYGFDHEVRNWFGYLEIGGERDESRDSIPAVAATVTSHARCKIRAYHDIAGAKEWCYTDTDSIWTSQTGHDNLAAAEAISSGVIGGLEFKKAYDRVTINGPKDYQADGRVKLKGVKPLSLDYLEEGDEAYPFREGEYEYMIIRDRHGNYRQTQFTRPLSQLRRQELSGVIVRYLTKTLTREVTQCRVMPDGWTRPLRMPAEHPDRD